MQRVLLAKFLVKMNQMTKSKGFLIESKNHNLEISYQIFLLNYVELVKNINLVPVFSHEQYNEKYKFQVEASRCLINFLNSACALKDQMRKYIRTLYGKTEKAFDGKYQDEVKKRFVEDFESQFFEQLRNYYDHGDILPISIITRSGGSGLYAIIALQKKDLLKSSFFKGKGKIYLENSPNEIDVLQLCTNYVEKSLFPWIMREQRSLHSKEFETLEAMKKELRDLMSLSKKVSRNKRGIGPK